MRSAPALSPTTTVGPTERGVLFPQPPTSDAPLILVVDDDQHGREGLAEFLVACGYRVIQAADGPEALAKVKLRQPAVVLLDLALPRIDGWHVAATIRRELALPGTRLVALSGLDYPNELARAVECGCDFCLPKPCDPLRLLETIRAITTPR
jgi:CheY-like chemotaxis protein